MPTNENNNLSPLAAYLSQAHICQKVIENIRLYSHSSLDETNPIQLLSRVFNDLPDHYEQLSPLIETVLDAARHDELGLWVILATYIGIQDLLDEDGCLLPELHAILNMHTSENNIGLMDYVESKIPQEEIAAALVSGYLLLLDDCVLAELKDNPDLPSPLAMSDPMAHPLTQCCALLTNHSRQLTKINKEYIQGLRQSLAASARDDLMKSQLLKATIASVLEDETPSTSICHTNLSDNVMTFFTGVKKDLQEVGGYLYSLLR